MALYKQNPNRIKYRDGCVLDIVLQNLAINNSNPQNWEGNIEMIKT
jgi:hypothetical protein